MAEVPQNPENINVQAVEDRYDSEKVIAWGERVLAGEFTGDLDEYQSVEATTHVEGSEGDYNLDDGVVLDLNNKEMDLTEGATVLAWLEQKLGNSINEAQVRASFLSPDQTTTFRIFDKKFGRDDNPWYISKWQNEGEEPAYIIWSEDMYDQQEEYGFTRIEEENSTL